MNILRHNIHNICEASHTEDLRSLCTTHKRTQAFSLSLPSSLFFSLPLTQSIILPLSLSFFLSLSLSLLPLSLSHKLSLSLPSSHILSFSLSLSLAHLLECTSGWPQLPPVGQDP
jgi:hypothetical protein